MSSGGSPVGRFPHLQPSLNGLVAAVAAPSVALSGADGQMRGAGAHGLYVDDVRILHQLVVRVEGEEPVAVGCELIGGRHNRFDSVVFNAGIPRIDPTVARTRTALPDGAEEVLVFSSNAAEPVAFRLDLELGSDLAPIEAVKTNRLLSRRPPVAAAGQLEWPLPDGGTVAVESDPRPDELSEAEGRLSWQLQLAPGERRRVRVTTRRRGASGVVVAARPPRGGQLIGSLRVEAADRRFQRLADRGLADLDAMLLTTPVAPDEVFVAAGAPWFLTLFGRDSLWVARMLLPIGTEVALGTLRTLAERQGTRVDPASGEEPGKILHELRNHPVGDHVATYASLPPVYYGTVDATALWVCLLGEAWRFGLAAERVAELLGPMERCLGWIGDYACRSDGFVSYVERSGRGLTNQGWKDSDDAIQFRDGRLATAPIALCEVQGYTYQALVCGAELLAAFGRGGGERWLERADELATRFRERFWVDSPEGPYPAVAIDGAGQAVDSLTSNIGHLLGTGILTPEEERSVAARLGSDDLDCGFGLRTLAASSAGFNPLGYHTGSVWAHDTAIAIGGLARSSAGEPARHAAVSLAEGLLAAAEAFDYRLPELYGGHARDGREAPSAYPAACRPQAWAAASVVTLVSALLGLRADAPA